MYKSRKSLYLTVLSIVLISICLTNKSYAAESSLPFHGSIGLSVLNLAPRGEFADFVTNDGWGINLFGTCKLWESPLAIGLDLVATNYGSETSHIPFNYWSGGQVTVEMETTSSIYSGGIFLRLQPDYFPIQPYMDGIIVFNNLTTETTIRDEDDWDEDDEDNEIASSTNLTDSAFSYGIGGGVMLKVFSFDMGETAGMRLGSLLLDFGCRYMVGGEAEYLNVNKEDWITTTDPADGPVETTFHPDQSLTDTFTIDFGLVFKF